MKRTNKKAFTIVELVIVIAIIAILAAVLIPTFASVIKKANISKDDQLVRNLNTALATDRAENANKPHANMTQALEAAEKFGYEVAKINASATDNEILWDAANDVFCYYNAEKGEIEYIPNSIEGATKPDVASTDYWCIITDKNLSRAFTGTGNASSLTCGVSKNEVNYKWSCYLAAAPENVNTITTATGVDVGTLSDITNIYYTNSDEQEVVIRTNSANTALTINAPSDTVKHYGAVGSLNIIAVANASYHEYGQVAFAEIATGRIVLESESKVDHIHLTATGTGSAARFNDITVAKASNVEMPEFSRDTVEIPAEGKLVVALQDGTAKETEKDYVWLTAIGIYEQVVVSDQKEDLNAEGANNSYAADSNNQEQKAVVQQIANNITFTAENVDYKVTATKSGDVWTYEVKTEEGASTNYTASVEDNKVVVKDSANVEVETTTENGITAEEKETVKTEVVNEAIENTEYKVAVTKEGETTKFMTLEAFRDSVNNGNSYAGYIVKLLGNIDLNGVDWTPIGNSYKNQFKGTLVGATKETVITGLTFSPQFDAVRNGFLIDCSSTSNNDKVGVGFVAYLGEGATLENITFEDVNINITDAQMDGILVGVAVGYLDGGTIKNVTIKSGTVSAVYRVGGLCGAAGFGTIENCEVSADVVIKSTGEGSTKTKVSNNPQPNTYFTAAGLIGCARQFTENRNAGVTVKNTIVSTQEITSVGICKMDNAELKDEWTICNDYNGILHIEGTTTPNVLVQANLVMIEAKTEWANFLAELDRTNPEEAALATKCYVIQKGIQKGDLYFAVKDGQFVEEVYTKPVDAINATGKPIGDGFKNLNSKFSNKPANFFYKDEN